MDIAVTALLRKFASSEPIHCPTEAIIDGKSDSYRKSAVSPTLSVNASHDTLITTQIGSHTSIAPASRMRVLTLLNKMAFCRLPAKTASFSVRITSTSVVYQKDERKGTVTHHLLGAPSQNSPLYSVQRLGRFTSQKNCDFRGNTNCNFNTAPCSST